MKKIPFVKMVGAGNDFVIVEELKTNLPVLAREICQRKTGIGADGLLVLEKSRQADFKMLVFNPDGSEAEMCGNGARCMAVYLATVKKVKKQHLVLETKAGLIEVKAHKDEALINVGIPKEINLDVSLDLRGRPVRVNAINTGVPHAVIFVDGIDHIDVCGLGREVRFHPKFAPRGTNVNFAEQLGKDFIKVRTYERGVENETLACGTGSVASSIITFLKMPATKKGKGHFTMRVLTLSTEVLKVHFDFLDKKVFNVWLEGKAKLLYSGVYYV